MATRVRVTRLANPRRARAANPRRRRRVAARSNSHRRRNMPARTASGRFVKRRNTARRTVKAANPRRHRRRRNIAPKVVTRYKTRTVVKYRNRRVKANPAPKRRRRTHAKRRTRRNPALLVTLGAINPRRRKTMARRKSRRRSRRNPATVTVRRNRRRTYARSRGGSHRRRNSSRRVTRRNPVLFGHNMSPTTLVKTTIGVLAGVAIAKLIPPMLPGSLTSSPAMKVIVTGVVAFLAGMAGNKMSPDIGSAILLGGLAQTTSQALSWIGIGQQLSLNGGRGMGMLVPGGFPMPQNPVNVAALAPAPSMMPARGVSGWNAGRGIAA